MTEEDILYENGYYWVCKIENGWYEVYKNGITHATRCAVIGYQGEKGLNKAICECDKRANSQ